MTIYRGAHRLLATLVVASATFTATLAPAETVLPVPHVGTDGAIYFPGHSEKMRNSLVPPPTPSGLGGVTSGTLPAHNFATGVSTSGVLTNARPDASDSTYTSSALGAAPTDIQTQLNNSIYLTSFPGVDPTGATSSVAGIINALKALNYRGGGELIVNKGVYKIDASIDCSGAACAQTSNWTIRFEAGAIFKATPALSTSALKVYDATQTQTYTLDIYNANFDLSQATCGPACQGTEGTTAIEVQGQRRVTLHSPSCTGGTSYNNNHANNCGTATKIESFQVIGGDATGFVNGAFYIVGDLLANGPGNYSASVSNFHCAHVITCVEAKFSLDSINFTNNTCDYCHIGFGTFNAGSNNVESSARFAIVKGNVFRHTQQNAVQINGQTLADVEGNIGIDVGYDETNTLSNSTTALFLFNGAAGSTFSNNTCAMRDWANSGFVCAQVLNVTFNGITYQGGGLVGSGNSMQGTSIGLYEGPGVLPSLLTATYINNVPTISGGTPASGTTIEYLTAGGTRSTLVGGSTVGFIGQIASQPLSGIGSLNAASTSSLQSYSVPGATSGDTVIVTPLTGGLTSTPALRLSARAIPDGVQLYAYNGTGSPYSFASDAVRIEVRRGH